MCLPDEKRANYLSPFLIHVHSWFWSCLLCVILHKASSLEPEVKYWDDIRNIGMTWSEDVALNF